MITDTASYSDIVFGLFAICGYQFSPRIADITDSRTWRIDTTASYGPLDELPRRKIRLTVDQPPAPITQHRTTVVVPVGGEESVELAARGQVSDQLAHPPPIAGARPIGEYLALEPALVPVENLMACTPGSCRNQRTGDSHLRRALYALSMGAWLSFRASRGVGFR